MIIRDPIADFFCRIRNAQKAKHPSVEMPSSKMKVRLAEFFKREGFVSGFHVLPGKPRNLLQIDLRYRPDGKPMIQEIKRYSRGGRRWYAAKDEIPELRGDIATMLLSTSKGLMNQHEAKEANVGGELICRVI